MLTATVLHFKIPIFRLTFRFINRISLNCQIISICTSSVLLYLSDSWSIDLIVAEQTFALISYLISQRLSVDHAYSNNYHSEKETSLDRIRMNSYISYMNSSVSFSPKIQDILHCGTQFSVCNLLCLLILQKLIVLHIMKTYGYNNSSCKTLFRLYDFVVTKPICISHDGHL